DTISAGSWNETQWQLLIEIWRDDKNYSVNDKVVYENGVYKAKVNVVSGNWDPRHWEVLDLIQGIREKQIDIINNSSNNAHVKALNKKISQADAVVDQLEEDAREQIGYLKDLLNDHKGGQKSRLTNPEVSSFSIGNWKEGVGYTLGDYVMKDKILYKAIHTITEPSLWNKNHWENRTWNNSKAYKEDSYVQKDFKVYKNTSGFNINANTGWVPDDWKAYNPSKGVLESVVGVLGTLADNIKAVDDEVDARAAASDYIADQQETPFPLVASVCALTRDGQPAAGLVIGADSTEKPKLKFTLSNIGLSPVTFTDNAEFRFIIPKGNGVDKLVETSSAAGTMDPQSESPSDTQDTVVFKWKPSSEKTIQAGEKETFTISNITPNAMPGFVTVFIEYQGIEGYSEGRLGVGVSKITRDISQLVGGGNVGIGTRSPAHKLQVNGPSMMIGGSDHKSAQLKISAQNTGGSGYSTSSILMEGYATRAQGIYFTDTGKPETKWFAGINYFTGFDTYSIGYDADGGGLVQNREKSLLTVKGSNGNVGIGTTNPEAPLSILGDG
ncbi:MAG: hypothetical protein HRT70_09235, partial [Flavobacteriaceae bacterium]|nr:hypothetical protein [Flavobacteriaceae bacterium]